jgi:hypothetical protein
MPGGEGIEDAAGLVQSGGQAAGEGIDGIGHDGGEGVTDHGPIPPEPIAGNVAGVFAVAVGSPGAVAADGPGDFIDVDDDRGPGGDRDADHERVSRHRLILQ